MDPTKRFALSVLFQAQQDDASELVMRPATSERSPIRYKVAGTWHDLAPPPAQVVAGAVAEVGRLAGCSETAFPKVGVIDVAYSGTRLRWQMRMQSADEECILTRMQ